MFTCEFEDCSAEFDKTWKLQEHIAKHTGQRPFACDFKGCTKSFTRKPHLQRHQQSHTGRKDFVCTEEGCGQTFTLKDNLKKHVKRKHQSPDAHRFKCDHEGCDKKFNKKQTLKIHMYEHTNIKPFKCEQEGCEARFLLPWKLKRHAKTHEGYTCPEEGCNAVYYKWTLLRKHVAEDHVTEYKCSHCNKIFYKKFKLRVHMKNHRDTKEVFMCPREKCQYSSLKLNEMDLHIKNYHEGARPFACPQDGCSKTFGYKHSMVKHQVVHSPGYVKPQPKPKKKRGVSSHLAAYPDEATRGPRQLKKSRRPVSQSPCQKTASVQSKLSQVLPPITSNDCAVIHNEREQNSPVEEQVMDTDQQTSMPVNTTEPRVLEQSVVHCPVVEPEEQCDIDVGAEVEVSHVDDVQTSMQVNTTESRVLEQSVVHYPVVETVEQCDIDVGAEVEVSHADDVHLLVKEQGQLTGPTYVVTNVPLTADIETGADDLDSLIQAVTKTRNSTTKEVLNTNSMMKVGVLVT